jgi:LmbE family N-acetylglucosaminyl deacetylase
MGQDYSESGLARVRLEEQTDAAVILGVDKAEVFNLDIPDGELEASVENIGKIVWHIRDFKPDLIITHNPHEVINTFSAKEGVRWVNHRDHRNTGLIVTDAMYPYSRDKNFFPEQLTAGLSGHELSSIAYSDMNESSVARAFDITGYIEVKRRSLAASKSVIPEDHVGAYIEECRAADGRYYEVLGVYLNLG